MERLEKKLNRIAKKCEKYGCEFSYKKLDEFYKETKDESGNIIINKFVAVEAEGIAVMNNWQFVASVEQTKNGNIIKGIKDKDIEVPERYYNSKPICEHCNSKRNRKHTYIVRNTETNEFKQVGKSCLNDFTRGLSAEAITQYISYFDELIQGEAPIAGFSYTRYFARDEALLFISETIKKFGYVRTQDDGISTSIRAREFLDAHYGRAWNKDILKRIQDDMERVNFNHRSEDNVILVQNALEWISTHAEDNNYFHNLKTVCSLEYVTSSNFGILASLFPSYNRVLKYETEKRKKEDREEYMDKKISEHVGNIKDKVTINVAYFKCLTSWTTDFGYTYVYRIVGTDGNVYTWKTGKYIDDQVKTISGTVKRHTTYRDEKQTELTRCKVLEKK